MTRKIGKDAMNAYKTFSATVPGISHTKQGKECQDYSLHRDFPVMSIVVLADGHGDDNCFRSAKGAELAARRAVNGISEFIYPKDTKKGLLDKAIKRPQLRPMPDTEAEAEKMLRNLVKHIVKEWHDFVEKDIDAHPISDAELEQVEEKYKKRYAGGGDVLHHAYGTTLIAAAVTDDYWFGIHIGDGRFTVLYNDGSYNQPVPWDERCYLNVTTSICDDDAADEARLYFAFNGEKSASKKRSPLAIFLCSDGIDDNYPVQDNDKHLFKLYRTIIQTFAEEGEEGFESMCGNNGNGGQIKDLCNSFATKGKGDDTSLAGIVDMAMLEDMKINRIYEEQIAAETGGTATPPDKKVNTKNAHPSGSIAETEELPVIPMGKHI